LQGALELLEASSVLREEGAAVVGLLKGAELALKDVRMGLLLKGKLTPQPRGICVGMSLLGELAVDLCDPPLERGTTL
jgi:hypothetical protein